MALSCFVARGSAVDFDIVDLSVSASKYAPVVYSLSEDVGPHLFDFVFAFEIGRCIFCHTAQPLCIVIKK